MRHEPNLKIERYRMRIQGVPNLYGYNVGPFQIARPTGRLRIIASDGTCAEEQGWEHVSVSLANRKPNWDEMCFVKDLFWTEDETVIQFHPRKKDYIDFTPTCLHLWRKRGGTELELPPSYLVGPLVKRDGTTLEHFDELVSNQETPK